MSQTLFGIETEYACVPVILSETDTLDEIVTVPDQMMEHARRTLVHLPDRRSPGMFLGNGARFYVDCGSHPEYATPECDNPWDVVRHVLAGDRILASLAADVRSDHDIDGEVSVFKNNVDLSGTGATWGCHESYLHRVAPEELAPQIIPHLVSRIIYTGAGGFHPTGPGLTFSVSPRVAHIARTSSSDSTSNRGIYHTKNEPLSRGYHRLHVVCGESLCSHLASWLKVGTTALIVALIDAGVRPWTRPPFRKPVTAFQSLAADPTCSTGVRLTNGELVTALGVQEAYLSAAEASLGRPFMPGWAAEVCHEWRSMLRRLAQAPDAVDRTLDWAIKWALYDRCLRRRGLTWDRVLRWQAIVVRLDTALARLQLDDPAVDRLGIEDLLGERSPIPAEVRQLTRSVRAQGLDWAELVALTALRRELYEAETRFSQLGTRGIFAALDADGVLCHRLPGVDQIEDAVREPPNAGRAHTRGSAVQRLAGREGWSCDWSGIWDHVHQVRALDLSDPFEQRTPDDLDRLQSLPRSKPAAPRRRRVAAPERDELVSFMDFLRRRD